MFKQTLTLAPTDYAIFKSHLEDRAMGDILPKLERQGLPDLEPKGVTILPDRPVLGYFNGVPWVVMKAEDDPLILARRLPITYQKAEQLRLAYNVAPELQVFMAHELAPQNAHLINPNQPIPVHALMPPPQQTHSLMTTVAPVARKVAKYGVIGLGAAIVLVPIITTVLAAAAATTALTAVATAAIIDPIAYGVLTLSGRPAAPGEPVYVIQLARWDI